MYQDTIQDSRLSFAFKRARRAGGQTDAVSNLLGSLRATIPSHTSALRHMLSTILQIRPDHA